MSQVPSTFVRPTLTLLPAKAPSGFSLLVVTWLMNTSTSAVSGCTSATAARTTDAFVLTSFSLAAGVTICSARIRVSLAAQRNILPDLLANAEPLHLAARRAGQVLPFWDLVQLFGPFLPGHPGPFEVRAHLGQRRHGPARFHPQHGHDMFAESCVGRSHHHGRRDRGQR